MDAAEGLLEGHSPRASNFLCSLAAFAENAVFDSIKMRSQRTADFSGNDGDFGALCAGSVALDAHTVQGLCHC